MIDIEKIQSAIKGITELPDPKDHAKVLITRAKKEKRFEEKFRTAQFLVGEYCYDKRSLTQEEFALIFEPCDLTSLREKVSNACIHKVWQSAKSVPPVRKCLSSDDCDGTHCDCRPGYQIESGWIDKFEKISFQSITSLAKKMQLASPIDWEKLFIEETEVCAQKIKASTIAEFQYLNDNAASEEFYLSISEEIFFQLMDALHLRVSDIDSDYQHEARQLLHTLTQSANFTLLLPALLDNLHHRNLRSKEQVICFLGLLEIHGAKLENLTEAKFLETILPTFIEFLSKTTTTTNNKIFMIDVLLKANPPSIISILMQTLKDQVDIVRENSFLALKSLPGSGDIDFDAVYRTNTINILNQRLFDRKYDPNLIIDQLVALDAKESIPELLRLFDLSMQKEMIMRIQTILKTFRYDGIIYLEGKLQLINVDKELTKLMEYDLDIIPNLKDKIRKNQNEDAYLILINLLEDKTRPVRKLALKILKTLKYSGPVNLDRKLRERDLEPFVNIITNPNSSEKQLIETIFTISSLHYEESIPYITPLLDDRRLLIQLAAERMLRTLNHTDEHAKLKESLTENMRHIISEALKKACDDFKRGSKLRDERRELVQSIILSILKDCIRETWHNMNPDTLSGGYFTDEDNSNDEIVPTVITSDDAISSDSQALVISLSAALKPFLKNARNPVRLFSNEITMSVSKADLKENQEFKLQIERAIFKLLDPAYLQTHTLGITQPKPSSIHVYSKHEHERSTLKERHKKRKDQLMKESRKAEETSRRGSERVNRLERESRRERSYQRR